MRHPYEIRQPTRRTMSIALVLALLVAGAPASASAGPSAGPSLGPSPGPSAGPSSGLAAGAGVADDPAAGSTIEELIEAYLAEHPGGVRINETELAYDGGTFIVGVARPDGPAVLAAADCPSGWYCFYDGTNYTYPRGRLSDCGWQDLGTWGWRNRTESAHYNLSYGNTTFLDETGATDTKLFVISTANRTIADVSPHRNRADYVYRACS